MFVIVIDNFLSFIFGGRVERVVFSLVSRPKVDKGIFITRFILLTDGLDTGFALLDHRVIMNLSPLHLSLSTSRWLY